MIRKLRQKFIAIAMLSLLGVLVTLVAAINIVFYYQGKTMQDNFFQMVNEREQYFETLGPERGVPQPLPDGINEPDRLGRERNMPFNMEHCVVRLSFDKQILDINIDNSFSFDEETITEYTQQILSAKKTEGWIKNLKFRIYENTNGYSLIMIDGSPSKASSRSILLISVSIAVFSYLIVFILVVLFSNKAIKPIAESYEKQKQFITDAGHELKTPLTVISANTEIARMNFGECEWFDGIDKQTKRLENLVRNLVSLTKMDEENREVIIGYFSISDAVYDTAMAYQSLAQRKDLTLIPHIENNIEYCGDESSLRQVFAILLDNAIKYCDDGGTIQVKLCFHKYIILTVTNSYSADTPLALDRVFDRFYRADPSRASNGSYGLGLSIAQAIVEKHNSSIKAKRLPSGDVQFTVTFK